MVTAAWLLDEDGYAPVHWASAHSHSDLVELLEAHGANVSVPADQGETRAAEGAEKIPRRAMTEAVSRLAGAPKREREKEKEDERPDTIRNKGEL